MCIGVTVCLFVGPGLMIRFGIGFRDDEKAAESVNSSFKAKPKGLIANYNNSLNLNNTYIMKNTEA